CSAFRGCLRVSRGCRRDVHSIRVAHTSRPFVSTWCLRRSRLGTDAPAPVTSLGSCSMAVSETPLLRVEALVKHYPLAAGGLFRRAAGTVKAVDGISFDLRR